ncbi:MAG TPA: hypothetical protein VFQ27_05040 [Xanthobacteraceae bacterium]|nr:hypothetical protein [Xanthobacteraceae bacterium]
MLAIWAVGMVPAALVMLWLGYAESSWPGFFKAWAALLVLAAAYELLETWISRWLERRRARRAADSQER